MKDRISANPGRVLVKPENGDAEFYATLARADNPIQEGDALNKANLLKDETAALLGLPEDAVPDDAFEMLAKPHDNLLDNWYFKDPLNSKGQTEYTTEWDYAIDRWKISGGAVQITNNGVYLTAQGVQILQPLKSETVSTINGKTVTISALDGANNLHSATYTFTTEFKGFVIDSNFYCQSGLISGEVSVLIGTQSGAETIKAVKLELGAVQTLAHQENGVWVLNDTVDKWDKKLLYYWWKRRIEETGYEFTLNESGITKTFYGNSSGECIVYYSDNVTINADNTISLLNPTQITLRYSSNDGSEQMLLNKYFSQSTENLSVVYKANSTITLTKRYPAADTLEFNFYPIDSYTGKYFQNVGEYEYVSSPNRNAYPDSGTEGIFFYQYLAVPFENAREGAKIVTGSYVGTGTYGSSNPNSLTFDAPPKMVVMLWQENSSTSFYRIFGAASYSFRYTMILGALTTSYVNDMGFGDSSPSYGKKSDDGKTIYWYNTGNAGYQCNNSGYVYHYAAIL